MKTLKRLTFIAALLLCLFAFIGCKTTPDEGDVEPLTYSDISAAAERTAAAFDEGSYTLRLHEVISGYTENTESINLVTCVDGNKTYNNFSVKAKFTGS